MTLVKSELTADRNWVTYELPQTPHSYFIFKDPLESLRLLHLSKASVIAL